VPTASPTQVPTEPTALPTLLSPPTADPTIEPTFTPTFSPTAQAASVLFTAETLLQNVTANFTMDNGISLASFGAAIAYSMEEVDAWDVTVVNATLIESEEDVSPEAVKKVLFVGDETEYAVDPLAVNYTMRYSVVFDVHYINEIQTKYAAHTKKLTDAMLSGNFTFLLQDFALGQGSAVMANAFSNTPPVFTMQSVYDQNSDGSGGSKTIVDNTAIMAIIVIGAILLLAACIALGVYLRNQYVKEVTFATWMASGTATVATKDRESLKTGDELATNNAL
jgi:hypothetical protein